MGSGKGAGRGSLESIKRCGRTVFFLVNMVGSLFVSSGPLLVSILDIFVVLSAFTCCRSCFSFRADWATYSFRGSLVDIPLLSVGRSLAALCKLLFIPPALYFFAFSRPCRLLISFMTKSHVVFHHRRCLRCLWHSKPLPWSLLADNYRIRGRHHGVSLSESFTV